MRDPEQDDTLDHVDGSESEMESDVLDPATVGLVASVLGSATARFAPGFSIGPYRLLEGDSSRWKAVDAAGNPVYVRIIPTRLAAAQREAFLARARAVARLKLDSVIPVRAVEKHGDVSLVVSSGHPGRTLRSRVASGPLPAREAKQFAIHLLEALSELHRANVVHGCLSPSVVHVEGTPWRVRFTSLCYENWLSGDETLRSREWSPYAAPEQRLALGVDARTDVYGAGLLVFEAYTGVPMGHLLRTGDSVSARDVFIRAVEAGHSDVWEIISRSTHIDPALRYNDAAEALNVLLDIGGPDSLAGARSRPRARDERSGKRGISRALVTGALALAAALVTWVTPS